MMAGLGCSDAFGYDAPLSLASAGGGKEGETKLDCAPIARQSHCGTLSSHWQASQVGRAIPFPPICVAVMTQSSVLEVPPMGGFSFDLCRRNAMLQQQGASIPKYRKTGATIVGLLFEDGVILGPDTRATEGEIVCNKNCEKIHYLAPNISCCGAGTAADTENVTDMVSS